MQAKQDKLSFEKVWLMFQETDKKFKETDRQFQETKLMLLDTDKKFQETDKKFQEMEKAILNTDIKFQETDKILLESDKKSKKLEHLFTSQWGKLIESLVEGDLIRLLNEKGIAVRETYPRVKTYYNDRQYEFDIIAANGDEVVVVEVKTTLRPDDIVEFLEELSEFKQVLPRFAPNRIIGAVAFLTEDGGSERMAAKKGLYTIKATGNSASITNAKNFKPKIF
ncbi:MAG: hypothetical protein HW421_3936 [Ignavibacteria bacterium]|nr:hypothetical protein [Ignavibacteria bacterium]